MAGLFGREEFGFVPETYVLPQQMVEFKNLMKSTSRPRLWIVKPNTLSRGRGIYLVEDPSEIKEGEECIVSRYVDNPFTINGYKFDLRIYVAVTCFDPLKIYVFKEGLARFATEKYSKDGSKDNRYMHLTNYSINKKSMKFVKNSDLNDDSSGFKWSLTAFCEYMRTEGHDTDKMWSDIYDVIVKSILSGEKHVVGAMRRSVPHKSNCFELFGYDVMLDEDLKPWLMEINLSPSLSCETPMDFIIKSTILTNLFNMIGF